jgi:primosomal protein N' (replication factor Y)
LTNVCKLIRTPLLLMCILTRHFSSQEDSMPVAHVALPVPLPRTFDYLLPDSMSAKAGCRVTVPFGKQQRVGIVVSVSDKSELPLNELKSVVEVLDSEPVLLHQHLATAAVGGGLLSSPDWRRPVPRPANYAAPGQERQPCADVVLVCHRAGAGRRHQQPEALAETAAGAGGAASGKIWRHQVDELEVSETALQALRKKG